MRLLLLGCTGFVGRELVPTLLKQGHQLTLISRRMARGYEAERAAGDLTWLQLDPASATSWQDAALLEALNQADAVVNLTGEPIAEKRWTPAHLRVLEASRLQTTRLLVEAMAASATPPGVLINASAIGFYGTSATARFVESSPAGGISWRRSVNAGNRRRRRHRRGLGSSASASASFWQPMVGPSARCCRCSARVSVGRSAADSNG